MTATTYITHKAQTPPVIPWCVAWSVYMTAQFVIGSRRAAFEEET